MPMKRVLFGVRSPLVVDYEESLGRLSTPADMGVSLGGQVRLLRRAIAVPVEELGTQVGMFWPCAFHPRRRSELARIAEEHGLTPAEALIDPTAVVARSARIGAMSYVNAAAVIGGATFVGDRVLINRCASVGHHCVLQDGVSLGPGATLAGNIKIGADSIIGVGATVLPDVQIGTNCIVAGGSLVRKDVPDGTFIAGNPAVVKEIDMSRSVLGSDDQE